MDAKSLGSWGERVAADYLGSRGYEIIEMNYRTRHGEVDIIAQDLNFLVFAEVKLRKNDRFAKAREFVTTAKRERIKTCALIWLSENEAARQPRFDVIEIYAPGGSGGGCEINHIENAFE